MTKSKSFVALFQHRTCQAGLAFMHTHCRRNHIGDWCSRWQIVETGGGCNPDSSPVRATCGCASRSCCGRNLSRRSTTPYGVVDRLVEGPSGRLCLRRSECSMKSAGYTRVLLLVVCYLRPREWSSYRVASRSACPPDKRDQR
jgi:hypothetical protein